LLVTLDIASQKLDDLDSVQRSNFKSFLIKMYHTDIAIQ